jgi:hypothetical protein
MSEYITPHLEKSKPYSIKDWARDIYDISENHFNKINYYDAIDQTASNSTLDFLIVLLCVSAFALVTAFYNKRFKLLLNTFFNWKLAKQIIRYEKVHSHPVNLTMLFIFAVSTPIFFCKSLIILYPKWEFFELFKYVMLILIAYFLVKYLLYQFSAWLFEEKELVEQYIFQGNLYSKFVGLVYLSLLILHLYSPFSNIILLKVGLIVLLIFLLLQLSRGIIIGLAEKRNLLVIILYLCTLEILPWLLMYKSIQDSL